MLVYTLALAQYFCLTGAYVGSDGHKSTYDWKWLENTQTPVTSLYRESWDKAPWTTDVLSASGPSPVSFSDVMEDAPTNSDKGMKQLMGNIVSF